MLSFDQRGIIPLPILLFLGILVLGVGSAFAYLNSSISSAKPLENLHLENTLTASPLPTATASATPASTIQGKKQATPVPSAKSTATPQNSTTSTNSNSGNSNSSSSSSSSPNSTNQTSNSTTTATAAPAPTPATTSYTYGGNNLNATVSCHVGDSTFTVSLSGSVTAPGFSKGLYGMLTGQGKTLTVMYQSGDNGNISANFNGSAGSVREGGVIELKTSGSQVYGYDFKVYSGPQSSSGAPSLEQELGSVSFATDCKN